MATGTVKWFNPQKGYGFIEPGDGSSDAFVHISAVEQAGLSTLREGQKSRVRVGSGSGRQIICGKPGRARLIALQREYRVVRKCMATVRGAMRPVQAPRAYQDYIEPITVPCNPVKTLYS